MAERVSAALFRLRFDENLFSAQRSENVSPTTIYRIPSSLRDLDPNAYEPRVVSIGPYHYGKEQLQAMEKHKYRALNRFLGRNDGISLDGILAEFREPSFSENVRNCYTESLEPQWSDDDVFFHLMVLDGCFLLELMLDPTFINDRPEKHALLSYVKMDMLVLDNHIPLLVLRKLASIANLPTGSESVSIQVDEPVVEEQVVEAVVVEAGWRNFFANLFSGSSDPQPTGSENVSIQADEPVVEEQVVEAVVEGQVVEEQVVQLEEPVKELNITGLIWKFYGTMKEEIPADLLDDSHHVLDAYWRKGCTGTSYYDSSRRSAKELYYLGVQFQPSSGGGVADGFVAMGSFTGVKFCEILSPVIISDELKSRQNRQEQQSRRINIKIDGREQQYIIRRQAPSVKDVVSRILKYLWWLMTFNLHGGILYLPRLTIDGTTKPTLLNLMAFERYKETHPVTDYVSLMGSLIRSENDVQHLRKEWILLCSPGWTDESVVKLFSDLTRNVAFDGTRKANAEIDALCKRPANKFESFWRRVASSESSDAKAWCLVLFTVYGLVITGVSTCFSVAKYFDDKKHKSVDN